MDLRFHKLIYRKFTETHGSHRSGKSQGGVNSECRGEKSGNLIFDIKPGKSPGILIACQIYIQLTVTAVF